MKNIFSYNIYDRQLEALLTMSQTVLATWEDHDMQELSIDLTSLAIKSGRLCRMATEDQALQQDDFTFSRKQQNADYDSRFNSLVQRGLLPLAKRITENTRAVRNDSDSYWTEPPATDAQMISQPTDATTTAEITDEEWREITTRFSELTVLLKEKENLMDPSEAAPIQCLLILFEYVANTCYLSRHFHRMNTTSGCDVAEEEAGKWLQHYVLQYTISQQGKDELKRYMGSIRFNNDGELTIDILKKERKAILSLVPKKLQNCFIDNIYNIDELGKELFRTDATAEEHLQFLEALAKWQLITQEIEYLSHPEKVTPALYNNVFVTMLHDSRVDMIELKKKIKRMLIYAEKKGHWFCVWSVLKHRNLLRETNYAAFAKQMMHEDWFGADDKVFEFTGDTLSDFSGYFSNTEFTIWNDYDFQTYRKTHKKEKKWKESLCKELKDKCERMNEVMRAPNP